MKHTLRTVKRRDFLRVAGLAGASGLLWACAPAPAPAKPTEAPKPAEAKPAATSAPAVAAKPTELPKPAEKPVEAKPAAQPTTAPVAAATAKPSGTLTIAQGADTTSLDPQQTQASAPRGMMRSFLESLLIFDHDLKIQPWLARSYALVNPTTWEFKLRDDVSFHNGEKFTAEAVKWSVQRFVDPQTKNIYASVLEPVAEVQAVDDYTVRMITKAPMPSLPATLATWLFIAPPKAM
jgi:ABC-type transport system substrate-binding protein